VHAHAALKQVSALAQAGTRLCISRLRTLVSSATNAAAITVRTFASIAPITIKFLLFMSLVRITQPSHHCSLLQDINCCPAISSHQLWGSVPVPDPARGPDVLSAASAH